MKLIFPYTMLAGDNLNQKPDLYVQQANKDAAAVIYTFGDKWGLKTTNPISIFISSRVIIYKRLTR